MTTRRFDLREWEWIVKGGEDPVRAARRCGVTISAVSKAANRAGRTDLATLAERARSAARHYGEAA